MHKSHTRFCTFICCLILSLLFTGNCFAVSLYDEVLESNNEFRSQYIKPEECLDYEYISDLVSLADNITKNKTGNYEKAKAIHDWVAENIYYDNDYFENRSNNTYFDAYDIYINRRSVCAGYSNLTMYLMRACGIPCIKVEGYALGSGTDGSWSRDILDSAISNHAWNEAYVDGRWIIIDTTWDSKNRYVKGEYIKSEFSSKYFDISDEDFAKNHYITSRYISIDESQIKISGIFKYYIQDGCAVILGLTDAAGSTVALDIPAIMDGYPVTIIEENAFRAKKLSSLTIPNTVTNIKSHAFYGCRFNGIVNIPSSVYRIGEYAFAYLYEGKGFNVAANNKTFCSVDGVLYNKSMTILYNYPLGKTDEMFFVRPETTLLYCTSFGNCYNLKKLIIQNPKVERMTYTFYGCDIGIYGEEEIYENLRLEGLTSSSKYGKATYMGEYNSPSKVLPYLSYKIQDNTAIITDCDVKVAGFIDIPRRIEGFNVTVIEEASFENCTGITFVKIPETVAEIHSFAFKNCSNIEKVIMPESVISIANNAFFGCNSVKIYCYDDSYAKDYAESLGLTCIVYEDDSSNALLPFLTYKKSNNNITITGCSTSANGTFVIPRKIDGCTVTRIDSKAFMDCNGILSITIPDTIKYIGNNAFSNCTMIERITLPYSVTNIGNRIFDGCEKLTAVNVDEYNDYFSSLDGVLYNKDKTELVLCPIGIGLKSFTVPGHVKKIREYAFYSSKLERVEIPSSVISIGKYAFYKCFSLKEVVFHKGIEKIGSYAFWNCYRLTDVALPNTVKLIENQAFRYCNALKKAQILNANADIAPDAFLNCHASFSIVGYEGSTAYQYAVNNNISFESLGKEPNGVIINKEFTKAQASGDTISVTVSIELISSEMVLIIAGYDENGRLLSVLKREVNSSGALDSIYNDTFELAKKNISKIKVMCWKDIRSMENECVPIVFDL